MKNIFNLMIVGILCIVAYVLFESLFVVGVVIFFAWLKANDTPCDPKDYFEE
jgi:hypothetical protein